MRLPSITSCLLGALFSTLPLHAADDAAQTPLDRLKSAADLTALDQSSLKPWHWKLDISVFDKDGKNPKTGSLEMWFSDGNLRSVESLGSKQITTLHVGNAVYRTSDDEKDFAGIRLIEMEVLHPIPEEVLQPTTQVKLVQQTVGTIKLDCLVPTVAEQSGEPAAGAQPISFCFEQGTPRMLVTQEPGNFSILRPRAGVFQGHHVPVELQVFSGGTMLCDAKTTKLETAPVDADLMQVKPDMAPVNGPVTLPAADLRGLILSKNPPVYPPEAKAHHVGGAVSFNAVIGKDGHVSSLDPMPQSKAELIASAKDAVSHWVFRPYMIDDVPVEVKTELTVVYAPGGPNPNANPDSGKPETIKDKK